jgi:hypothetical protein
LSRNSYGRGYEPVVRPITEWRMTDARPIKLNIFYLKCFSTRWTLKKCHTKTIHSHNNDYCRSIRPENKLPIILLILTSNSNIKKCKEWISIVSKLGFRNCGRLRSGTERRKCVSPRWGEYYSHIKLFGEPGERKRADSAREVASRVWMKSFTENYRAHRECRIKKFMEFLYTARHDWGHRAIQIEGQKKVLL